MEMKERIQKELDLLLEKIRFWRYVIFGIISGIVGIIFGASQNKISLNWEIVILFGFGFIGIVISIIRIHFLTKDYYFNLDLLEKEE